MPTGPDSTESLLRELLSASATQSAELRALSGRVDGVQNDAREARDVARDNLAQTKAQDLPTKVAELRGHLEASSQALRADLVNSITKLTAESRQGHDAHDVRLKALEDFKNRLDGATGFVGWLAKHAPWLLAVLFAGLAALGLKEKLIP